MESARRVNWLGVANLACVRVAMGAWAMLICLCPHSTGVHSSSLAIFIGGSESGMGVVRTPVSGVEIRGGTPGGVAGFGSCMYRLRMVWRVSIACNWLSAGAGDILPMVALMAWSAWIILSLVVTCGNGRLWGQNLMASLTMTARDSLGRTRKQR